MFIVNKDLSHAVQFKGSGILDDCRLVNRSRAPAVAVSWTSTVSQMTRLLTLVCSVTIGRQQANAGASQLVSKI